MHAAIRRLRLCLSLVVLAAIAVCLIAGPSAQAATGTHDGKRVSASSRHRVRGHRVRGHHGRSRRRHRHRTTRRHRAAKPRTGIHTVAPSAQATARTLSEMTGLAPSQVSIEPECSTPRAGHVGCAADVVVEKANGQPVHPILPPSPAAHLTAHISGPLTPQSASTGVAAPSAGSPAYLQQAYDLTWLSQTAGSGDTVAIVDAGDDPTAASDLNFYRSYWGLPACTSSNGCFRKVNQNGAASPLPGPVNGWEGEISLDLDAVSALCPNCHILLIEANSSAFSDMDQADIEGAALGAKQISDSWAGGAASAFGGTYTFAHASVIAATGDNGYLNPAVDAYPASLPGVTAAGGTTLTAGTSAAAAARGFSEAAWSGAGSGCNTYYAKPSYQTDTGCTGRSWADVSADANPGTGLYIIDNNNWELFGGTSLATPLVAAFEAVTGITTTTPQWPYTDSATLNDPASGSTGSCAANISYICNGRTGYDGPTGAGSISGAIVNGAPGIAGPALTGHYSSNLSYTGATLTGGVFPNGLATSYYWQYGTTTSYGQSTSSTSVGSGHAPSSVTTTLSGLSAGTTYHYRLVATNADGTSYGYDYTFATPSQVPVVQTAPAITGAGVQGGTLSVSSNGTWNPAATSYGYQWSVATSATSGWSNVAGATSSTYVIPSGGLGATYRVCVTATNSYGTGSKCSAGIGPATSGAPAYQSIPTIAGNAAVGASLSVTSSGVWSPAATGYTYQWSVATSAASGWSNVSGATGTSFTVPSNASSWSYRVCVTATNASGSASKCSSPIGPIA